MLPNTVLFYKKISAFRHTQYRPAFLSNLQEIWGIKIATATKSTMNDPLIEEVASFNRDSKFKPQKIYQNTKTYLRTYPKLEYTKYINN